ncbi:hypothetical protein JYU34_008698 [Plutella xylostella]|uniref:Uncharacterized protein n=1 Tax=Plutella xylostella TaxID=51655 RepID=A0ABQ7QLQ8_PLUXY|nr:hypothetical protein JYU34_008698 [Plutella xylostella]
MGVRRGSAEELPLPPRCRGGRTARYFRYLTRSAQPRRPSSARRHRPVIPINRATDRESVCETPVSVDARSRTAAPRRRGRELPARRQTSADGGCTGPDIGAPGAARGGRSLTPPPPPPPPSPAEASSRLCPRAALVIAKPTCLYLGVKIKISQPLTDLK